MGDGLAKIAGKWMPVEVVMDLDVPIVVRDKLRNGLLLCYPRKVYAIPAPLRFVIDPRLIEGVEGYEWVVKIPRRFKAVVRITVRKALLTKRSTIPVHVLNIEMLKPREDFETKKRLVVTSRHGRRTRMGGLTDQRYNIPPMYACMNASSSARHWVNWRVWLIDIEEGLVEQEVRISNRGNVSETLYDVLRGERVERYEELEVVESWEWGKVVKIRDNWTGEEFTALILEFHEARKTSAKTDHVIEPMDAVELVQTTSHSAKTHWTTLYKVLAPCRVLTRRVSNRGNVREWVVEVKP